MGSKAGVRQAGVRVNVSDAMLEVCGDSVATLEDVLTAGSVG